MAASQPRAAFGKPPPERVAHDEDFEEISLVDLLKVIYRRRAIVAVVLVLALVTGAALTLFTTPQYEAEAQVIPVEQPQIIQNWLKSRQAAEFAAVSVGSPLKALLYPGDWDATANGWKGTPHTDAEVATAILGHITNSGSIKDASPVLTVTVQLPDPVIAQKVAQAYLDSLSTLRPELENITRSALFDKYYDGTNAQDAQARAERAAHERSYWIVFDDPTVPTTPVKPRPVLNMALAGVLGVMGGVGVVFGLEWLSKYRADFQRVDPPKSP